jgi:hypothetical protein
VQDVVIEVGGVRATICPPDASTKGADGKTLTPQQWFQLIALVVQTIMSFLGGGGAGEASAQPGAQQPAGGPPGSKPR